MSLPLPPKIWNIIFIYAIHVIVYLTIIILSNIIILRIEM
jgi:hypothetical protein